MGTGDRTTDSAGSLGSGLSALGFRPRAESREPKAESLKPLFLERREIAFARANADVTSRRAHEPDLDAPPRPVGLLVAGLITERVLRPHLGDDLVVDGIEVFHRIRKECLPAGHLRDLLQLHPPIVLA